MAVKLRMKRLGNTHRPYYRVVAVDHRRKRDGRVIEELGTYNPLNTNEAQQSSFKLERCAYWLSVGAQPSQTVATLLKRQGLTATAGTRLADQPEDLDAAAAEAQARLQAEHEQRQRDKAEAQAKARAEAEAKARAEAEAAAAAKAEEQAKAEAQAKAAEAEAAEGESTEGEGEGESAGATDQPAESDGEPAPENKQG